jgi:uncharacterized protein (DUF1800 family)
MLDPLPPSKWNRAKTAHLLKRAGFGCSQEELDTWSKLSLEEAVNKLVDWELTPDPSKEPEWASPGYGLPIKDRDELRALTPERRREIIQEIQRIQRGYLQDLREDWMTRMSQTTRPLQEKLALFWHGHFATSVQKVKISYFMWKQLDLFRRLGHGSYEKLLVEVARDPAMLVWLDGVQSKKGAPNENFARELMELFTLGEGHYTEDDIKESARAFTGWSLRPFMQSVRFNERQCDTERKKFFGQSGNFNDEDIIRIILKQPQAARYITAKLWSFFAYENPEPHLVDRLAAAFTAEKMEFKPLLKQMFLSQEFYSPRSVQNQIKGPVQWWIAAQKGLNISRAIPRLSSTILNQMGQNLFDPPSVKGWDGGRAWISTNTLMLRHNVAHMMIYGGSPDQLGMGDLLKRFAEAAKKEQREENAQADKMQEQKPDPALERRQKIAEKALKRKIPGLVNLAKIVPENLKADREALVAHLAECLFQTTPSPALLKTLQESTQDTDRVLADAQIQALLYQMMTMPEYQLT